LGAGIGLSVVHFSRRALGLQAVEAPLRQSDLPWLALVIGIGGMLIRKLMQSISCADLGRRTVTSFIFGLQ
jgi:hypothetical protein